MSSSLLPSFSSSCTIRREGAGGGKAGAARAGAAGRPSSSLSVVLRHCRHQRTAWQGAHAITASSDSGSGSSSGSSSSSSAARRRREPAPLLVDGGDQRRRRQRRPPLVLASAAAGGAAAAAAAGGDGDPDAKPEQPHQQQEQEQVQQQGDRRPSSPSFFSFLSPPPPLPTPTWPAPAVGRVMALWLLAYLFLGRVFVPLLAALGLPLQAHPSTASGGGGVALAHLALDAAQLACTCLILRLGLATPWRELRQRGLFCFGWRCAREWVPAVLAGSLAFPLVGWAARWAAAAGLDPSSAGGALPPLQALPIEDALSSSASAAAAAGGSLVLEAGAAAAAAPGGGGAAAAALGYALVVAVCAPLWEEAVFRGFLLPSLAAYGPFGRGKREEQEEQEEEQEEQRAGAQGGGGQGGDDGSGDGDGDSSSNVLRPRSGTARTAAASLRAVVLSAAAFAGCHFRADTALPMFLLGLLFGGACVATRGRLAAPVALHGLWNLWAVAHSAAVASAA